MGVSIVANDRCAVFVCNTEGVAFGPTMSLPGMDERGHRELAETVLEQSRVDVRKVWNRNPDALHGVVRDAERELSGDVE